MICPFCLHEKSDVYNTRGTNKGTWRRRRCLNCGQSFTTREDFDPSGIWKVKKTEKAVAYSRPRLAMSLLRACDHRLDLDSTAWYLFEAVEQALYPIAAANEQLLTTADISEKAAEILKRFDAAAYVKYISYHQPTLDAKALRKRLRKA